MHILIDLAVFSIYAPFWLSFSLLELSLILTMNLMTFYGDILNPRLERIFFFDNRRNNVTTRHIIGCF